MRPMCDQFEMTLKLSQINFSLANQKHSLAVCICWVMGQFSPIMIGVEGVVCILYQLIIAIYYSVFSV